MFETRLLVRLSRLLHADIAFEVAVAKSPPKYVEFSIVLHDLNRLDSILCRVQTNRCTMITFPLIDSVIIIIITIVCHAHIIRQLDQIGGADTKQVSQETGESRMF